MYDIMNRSSSKDLLISAGAGVGGGRNHTNHHNINHNATINGGILPNRRPISFNKNNATENFNNNNNMDLFSRSRTSLPLANSDESDLQVRLARLSVGSAKPAKSILDDMLSSNEGGKHDYDWLLTPPGTPLFPTSDAKGSQPTPVTARSRSSVRSSSTNKTSRLSVSQSESNHPSRPARSSSVTRSSISSTQYTNYSSRNTNILNTSSASVSSYIRPSTPTNRSSSTTRTSTPSTRTTPSPRTSTPSRASTPSRTRPSSTTTSSIERPIRPSQNSRPSTPTSRPQTPGNLTSPTIRPPSRPSTPTRRTLTPSLSPSTPSLSSSGRGLSSNGRNVGSTTSRPSSPSPRVRPPPQPINLHDFPHETPPNLRTTLPDRPLSAGRSRPVVKGNTETSNTASITRRHSSPIVSRGRIAEPPGRGRPHANGHVVESLEGRRSSQLPESLTRRPIKSSNSENGSGFGRNISKKSLDMAIKHMDIRNGGARPLSGSTLFPQSIRSANSRTQPGRAISAPGSVDGGSVNGENGNYTWNNRGVIMEDQSPHSSKLSSEVDIYESSRYDAILLKEDLKNTSWLHSADDKIGDESPLFDNGFETLPEPFGPL